MTLFFSDSFPACNSLHFCACLHFRGRRFLCDRLHFLGCLHLWGCLLFWGHLHLLGQCLRVWQSHQVCFVCLDNLARLGHIIWTNSFWSNVLKHWHCENKYYFWSHLNFSVHLYLLEHFHSWCCLLELLFFSRNSPKMEKNFATRILVL